MAKNFTNAHSHIFTANHAPDYFLKTAINNIFFAEWIDKFLQKDGTRWVMKGFLKAYIFFAGKDKRRLIQRYLEFVQIGTSASQISIYDNLYNNYTKFGDFNIVVLTQVLDYLDLERDSGHIKIQTQVEEVCGIVRNALYQKNIRPFLGVDPRQTGFDLVGQWAKKYISKEFGFYGLKIYPAYGFFPFDLRLDKLWKWAEENQVPVMTHCTRGGSFYLGRFESVFPSGNLRIDCLKPDSSVMESIAKRIASVMDQKDIHKTNHLWCNIFGHPENYIPVLEKYPKLKICLAHFGGSDEVRRSKYNLNKSADDLKLGKEYHVFFQDNWTEQVFDLMQRFENVYSDISYTLSDTRALEIIREMLAGKNVVDAFGKPLMNKLLYGTDFYLTQQEELGDEPHLENNFLTGFSKEQVNLIAYENPFEYLNSAIFTG